MLREGKRIRTEHLDVRHRVSPLLHPRVGVIVPKYRKSSVDRNRLRRRLREAARLHILPRLGPVDVIVRARVEAYEASYLELCTELSAAVLQMGRS